MLSHMCTWVKYVCLVIFLTPVLKVLIPRQRDAAEPSCRLVTLVTVAVQQDPASLTPEAKPAELPRVKTWLSPAFSVLCQFLHLCL